MPRKKSVILCEGESGELEERSEAVSRVSRAIPIMAALSERVAKQDALVARLPTTPALFQQPTLFFCDNFDGDPLEWLTFDRSAADYSCSYHTPIKT